MNQSFLPPLFHGEARYGGMVAQGCAMPFPSDYCGNTGMVDVYQRVCAWRFPFQGAAPPLRCSSPPPRYSLWIKLLFRPTQPKVLVYAAAALADSVPSGVLNSSDDACFVGW